jgi:pSer/pThr/pTyr-binding forkhead associated (FHA) protein
LEASKYFLNVVAVLEGGNPAQIGKSYCCLASTYTTSASSASASVGMPTSDNNSGSSSSSTTLIGSKGKGEKKTASTSAVTASKDDLTIGRSRDNHVTFDDLSISKQHAVISYFEGIGGLFLRDLGSKHGTFVDGKQISTIDGRAPIPAATAVEVGAAVMSQNKNKTNGKERSRQQEQQRLNQNDDINTTATSNEDGDDGDINKNGKNYTRNANDPASSSTSTSSNSTTHISGCMLRDGMEVRFGRVVCTVTRTRQEAVLSSGYVDLAVSIIVMRG